MAGKDDLKSMVMTFRVAELQTLLAFAGRSKVGRKQELQDRAVDLIKLKSAPIQMKIREIYLKSTNGQAALQTNGASSSAGAYRLPPGLASTYENYFGGKEDPNAIIPNNLPVHPDVRLKRKPFFERTDELLKPSTLMPIGSGRLQRQSFMFHFTPAQANELAFHRDVSSSKSDYTLQVQIRFCLLETSCEQEDCFPPGIFVSVNGTTCPLPSAPPSTQPGVEPKRPPRPVNITPLVKMSPTLANVLEVHWAAEFGTGYAMAIELVKKLSASHLIQKLKSRGVRHADYTTAIIKEKLCEDSDSEIATTSLRVSLMCPLGKTRMVLPCRATTCTHLQCFDGSLYLHMNEKKSTWTCPVCDKPAEFEYLNIDGYFQEVLSSSMLPSDVHEIELHKDGTWSVSVAKREEKSDSASLSTVKSCGGPSAMAETVEILDDDLVPLDVSSDSEDFTNIKPKKALNVTTVDLTLSDDEDVAPALTPAAKDPLSDDKAAMAVGLKPPGNLSPSIIDLDSPCPSPQNLGSPGRPIFPSHTYPAASALLPPFFDLDSFPPLSPA